jgi:hypothetical protein
MAFRGIHSCSFSLSLRNLDPAKRFIAPEPSFIDQSFDFCRLARVFPRGRNTKKKFDLLRIPLWMGIAEKFVYMGIDEAHIVFEVSLCLIRGGTAWERILMVRMKVQFEILLDPDIIVFLITEESPGRCTSRAIVSNLSPDFVGELFTGNFWPLLYALGICPVSSFRKSDSCTFPSAFSDAPICSRDIYQYRTSQNPHQSLYLASMPSNP